MTFLMPNNLWLLLLLPLVWLGYEFYERRRIYRSALDYSYVATALSLKLAPPLWRRLAWPVLLTLSGALAIVGSARPEITTSETISAADYVVVFDVSISMAADDVEPSRIESAQAAVLKFAAGLPTSSRLGLVLFSDSAWVASPLDSTRENWEATVRSLNDDSLVGGTKIGDAIAVATEQFNGEEGAIVLVSDGEGDKTQLPVDQAAKAASSNGIRVYTIGVGAESGTIEFRGGEYDVEYNPADLKIAAESADGLFFEANKADDFDEIYKQIFDETSVTFEKKSEITWTACLSALVVVFFALLLPFLGV